MRTIVGDILKIKAFATAIPTNGVVKKDGSLVMGAGLAKDFRDAVPGLDAYFGIQILKYGNAPYIAPSNLKYPGIDYLISFPTKDHWKDPSTEELIESSAYSFRIMVGKMCDNQFDNVLVTLPAVGCGFGGLKWTRVKEIIDPIFKEDTWVVVFKE